MKKMLKLFAPIAVFALFLTGCAFPEEELAQNGIPYDEQISSVQSVIDKYREDHGGLLPIKNKEADTPIYEKYLIDFNKLIPEYMAEPPINAYEAGGVFQYVLVDVETEPKVKIFDLRMAEAIRELNLRLKMQEYPPFKERIADNVFTLDFSQLGYKEEPFVISPYTNEQLSFVISGNGKIYVDYTKDLYEYLQKYDHDYKHGDDIRGILVENSVFVPAYSLPYTIDEDGKAPVFLAN